MIIHWDNDSRLKTYSSSTRADGRSVVKVEIETHDPYELGHLLRQLSEISAKQEAAAREAAAEARAAQAAERQRLPAAKRGKVAAIEREPHEPTLLLEDRRNRR